MTIVVFEIGEHLAGVIETGRELVARPSQAARASASTERCPGAPPGHWPVGRERIEMRLAEPVGEQARGKRLEGLRSARRLRISASSGSDSTNGTGPKSASGSASSDGDGVASDAASGFGVGSAACDGAAPMTIAAAPAASLSVKGSTIAEARSDFRIAPANRSGSQRPMRRA